MPSVPVSAIVIGCGGRLSWVTAGLRRPHCRAGSASSSGRGTVAPEGAALRWLELADADGFSELGMPVLFCSGGRGSVRDVFVGVRAVVAY
jgi:hypothetical protein